MIILRRIILIILSAAVIGFACFMMFRRRKKGEPIVYPPLPGSDVPKHVWDSPAPPPPPLNKVIYPYTGSAPIGGSPGAGNASISVQKRSYRVSTNAVQFVTTGSSIAVDTATYIVTALNVALQPNAGTEPNYKDEIYTDADVAVITVEYTTGFFMDIYYVPANLRTDKPFLVDEHAGAGPRNTFTPIKYCMAAAKRGYVAATIDFDEVSGDFDNTRQKVGSIYHNAAVRKMKSLNATYGIDINRGVSMGQSRGGVNSWQGGIAGNNMSDAFFQSASNYAVNSENAGYTNTLVASASAPGSAGGRYIDQFLEGIDHPHRDWHGDEDDTLPIEWSQTAIAAMQAAGSTDSVLTTLVGEEHGINANLIMDDLFEWFSQFL